MSCPVTGELRCRCANKSSYMSGGGHKPTSRDTLRKLYTDQAMYLKYYMHGGAPDEKQAITNRLVENQKDISSYLEQYIGKENANKLSKSLNDHYDAITKYMDSIKNQANLEQGKQKLQQGVENVKSQVSEVTKSMDYDTAKQNVQKTTDELSKSFSDVKSQVSDKVNEVTKSMDYDTAKQNLEQQTKLIEDMAKNIQNKNYVGGNQIYDAFYNSVLSFSDKINQAYGGQQSAPSSYHGYGNQTNQPISTQSKTQQYNNPLQEQQVRQPYQQQTQSQTQSLSKSPEPQLSQLHKPPQSLNVTQTNPVQQQTGGKYQDDKDYMKYKKYKSKYLSLKKR